METGHFAARHMTFSARLQQVTLLKLAVLVSGGRGKEGDGESGWVGCFLSFVLENVVSF